MDARLLSGTLILSGCVLIGGYVWSAVIERWGLPDQSLLYWYLPLLLLGLGALRLGIRLRRRRSGGLR